jgi:protein ImuB
MRDEGLGIAMFACLRSMHGGEANIAIARDFSPRIERHGDSCVVFDVSGLERLLGDAHAIGAELEQARLRSPELLASFGGQAHLRSPVSPNISITVAPTQTAALLLAIARPGLSVATGDPGDVVAGLPLTAMRSLLCPADAARSDDRWGPLLDILLRWGLGTLGEVAALPPADLSARMGPAGVELHRLARGLDRGPLVPAQDVPRFVQSLELEWPIDTLEPLSFVLARLLDPLSAALERADRAAAALRLDLRLVDRTVHTRVIPLPAAIRDPRVLRTLLLLDLESHPPTAAIDIVTLEIDPAPSRIVQYSLLERAMPSPETLATLTARLGALVGDARCGSPALLDTHQPDGFEMRRFAPAPRSVVRGPRSVARDPLSVIRDPRSEDPGSRTAHLEGSRGGSRQTKPVLRRFRPPIVIRVTVERGCPVHIAIDRRRMPGGRVEQRAGPWRTSGAWWDAERTHWDRDEWDVSLSDGVMCRLFRDRVTGRWFMEGVLD